VTTVTFASISALLAVLTPKRYALVEAVKAHGSFDSIEALATAVSRDRAAVSRDLKALTEAGLLRIQEAVLPGHGRRSTIAPVARHLKVELTI
jgi:predicted transcriptional regulator